jgi:hypothetical protein
VLNKNVIIQISETTFLLSSDYYTIKTTDIWEAFRTKLQIKIVLLWKQVRYPVGANFLATQNFMTKGCPIPTSAAISLAVMHPFPLISLSFVSTQPVHNDQCTDDQ